MGGTPVKQPTARDDGDEHRPTSESEGGTYAAIDETKVGRDKENNGAGSGDEGKA